MGTSSSIGYQTQAGDYKYIYCNFDGYVDGVGADLMRDFNSFEKAQRLVDAGDCSTCYVSYTSKGEDFSDVKPRRTDILMDCAEYRYNYMYSHDRWWILDLSSEEWIELERALNGMLEWD
jgi:hypothetical protein